MQRQAMGAAAREYREVTEPVDRCFLQVTDFVLKHPILTSATVGLGSIALLRQGHRSDRARWLGRAHGLIRGGLLAVGFLKGLRAATTRR
jgi:hypothetical protein